MSTYYVGWDVGALYCKAQSKSHDALCVLDENEKVIVRNESPIIVPSLPDSIYDFCCIKQLNTNRLIIAIDGVFRWPEAMHKIDYDKINFETLTSTSAIENAYLFRETERFVKTKLKMKKNPFSVVQDSIGSQSIKVIAFLNKYNFTSSQKEPGIWKDGFNNIAIETYPSVVNNCKGKSDLQDAYICAKLAKMFDKDKSNLYVPSECPKAVESIDEGWIWFPKQRLNLEQTDIENALNDKPCPTQSKTN